MPFVSDKQRKFMYANHPEIAKRWSDEEKARKKAFANSVKHKRKKK